MLDSLEIIITKIGDFLWGLPLIVLLFGTHIYLTFKTGFVQKYIFKGIKLSVTKDPNADGEISSFGALTTALASTIGTGNIIGVSSAIVAGGPGAVFWTWMTGIFGIATKYTETYIAIKYRRKLENGTYIGGAMTALEHLNLKWLGIAFAIITALASFGIGCGVQSNAIASVMYDNYGISHLVTAVVIVLLTILVIFGGVKSIAKVCQTLVPLMSLLYILGCICILFYNIDYLPETFVTIISSAFSTRAMAGGFIGSTIMIAARYGIARGLFSNESGMGSAPIVAAAAQTRNPVRQALVSSTGTFWDTVVICAITGLVIVSSIIASPEIDQSDGGMLTKKAFGLIPYVGTPILTFGIITFAFSTILGWSYYGEKAVEYLVGKRGIIFYRIVYILLVYAGATMSLALVWGLSDIMNALMAIPNLLSLLLLSNIIAKDTQYYLWGKRLEEDAGN